MEQQPLLMWSSLIFSLLLFSLSPPVLAQEVEDEREFSYILGSEKGPERWGELKEEWATCGTGQMQSPIDLTHRIVEELPQSQEIIKFYKPGRAVLKNRGHDIMIEWPDEGSKIQIDGTEYILRQAHWHTPSEHAIIGKRFDAELHLVHQSRDHRVAVIGLLYAIGNPDPFLSKLMREIEEVSQNANPSEGVDAGVVDPGEIKLGGNMFYRYMGSLTTPPCTEGVLWTVIEEIATISEEQKHLLQAAVHDDARENARPLQPLNGREVKWYIDFTAPGEKSMIRDQDRSFIQGRAIA